MAFGLAYFQYCVSLKDLDAKERGKYLDFSRLLFSKEVALIEDVILHLKSNTSHQRKHKVRSLFELIGYPEWDDSSYAMFPIYDCVSVPRSISKVTSQLMEAVGRKHQYELRAEIEAPAVHVSTHDLPKSILQEQAHLHRVKGQSRAFTMTDMVRCHFKMEGWYNTEKEFFNLQYNQKSIRIRRRKDVSLYESFSSIEKALSKVGYALGGEAIEVGYVPYEVSRDRSTIKTKVKVTTQSDGFFDIGDLTEGSWYHLLVVDSVQQEVAWVDSVLVGSAVEVGLKSAHSITISKEFRPYETEDQYLYVYFEGSSFIQRCDGESTDILYIPQEWTELIYGRGSQVVDSIPLGDDVLEQEFYIDELDQWSEI